MNYKLSSYFLAEPLPNHDYIIFVTSTGKCFVISEEKYNILMSYQGKEIPEQLPFSWMQECISHRIIIPSEINEMEKTLRSLQQEMYSKDTLTVEIIPTMNCNFKCRYCFETSESKSMKPVTEKRVLKMMRKLVPYVKRVRLIWFGGEPLLEAEQVLRMSKAISDICKRAHVPMIGEMSTNGYLLTPDLLSQLVRCRIIEYQICLDGTPKYHNMSRPHITDTDSYHTILRNLLAIKEMVHSRMFRIYIRMNITKVNVGCIEEHLRDMGHYFAGDSRFYILAQHVRDWKGPNIDTATLLEESDQAYVSFYSYAISQGLQIADLSTFSPKYSLCPAAKQLGFGINWDGKIYKCALANSDPRYVEKSLIGFVDSSGNPEIDTIKESAWLWSCFKEQRCENCPIAPICFTTFCPYQKMQNEMKQCMSYIEGTIRLMMQEAYKKGNYSYVGK